jgi:hypothetical protein
MSRSSPQLKLSLRAPRRWGGARPGAGRKRDPDSGVRHASRADFRRLPAHVTLRMRRDVPSLRGVRIVREVERTFARGCMRPGFRLVHYSLQGNHAHLLVEATDTDALGRGMKAIGARLARAVNRAARRAGPVLADRYHLRLLPTPKEVRNALRYVLLNARRHAAAVAAAGKRVLDGPVKLDPASSARWFDGWKRGIAIDGDDDVGKHERDADPGAIRRPPVARARTWLLSVGWRRHGLIDPADVPASQ